MQQAKKYQFSNMAPELSVKMFEQHWELYSIYVDQLNATLSELSNPYNSELNDTANPGASRLGDLYRSKTYLINTILLHELFFENVILPAGAAPMNVGPKLVTYLQQDFSQLRPTDFWDVLIKPACKAARGWVVLGFSELESKLDVAVLDDHGGPLPLGFYPLLALDMYEHSYAPAYGIDRGTYIDHLRKSVNWAVVDHRMATIESATELMRRSVPEEAEEYIQETIWENAGDREFGFPNEESYPNNLPGTPNSLDNRQQLSSNPRSKMSASLEAVQNQGVTTADVQLAYDRITALSSVTFQPVDALFDTEVKGKSQSFRSALWAKLQVEAANGN